MEFYLDNDIQIDFLEGFKVEMLSYIRNSLQNNLIQFKPLAIQVQTEKIIYSDADKLTYLTEKYPIITEFRKKFGLENIY